MLTPLSSPSLGSSKYTEKGLVACTSYVHTPQIIKCGTTVLFVIKVLLHEVALVQKLTVNFAVWGTETVKQMVAAVSFPKTTVWWVFFRIIIFCGFHFHDYCAVEHAHRDPSVLVHA